MKTQVHRAVLLTVIWLAAAAAPAWAQNAYVGNQSSGNVSVIDTDTDTVVATIPTGSGPYGVAVAPIGSRAYVVNNGSDSVSFINTVTNTVAQTVAGISGAAGIAITPTGDRLYISTISQSTVHVVGTATGTVMDTIPVSGGAFGLAAHPSGLKVYVANQGSGQVSVIDTTTNTATATIPVGNDARGIAVNPAGTRVYAANFQSDTVSVIDAATEAVIATVAVGDGPWGVAVSPDGERVYATNLFDDEVSVIDAGTNTVEAIISVGDGPIGISVHPNGLKVYVANCGGNSVSVIDTATNSELQQIPLGNYCPVGLGQFIAGPSTTAASATAATGTLTITLGFPNLTGTLYFDYGTVSIFGTPVDVAAAVGYTPMDVSGSLIVIPGGAGLSATATSSYNPSFSLSGTGSVALGFGSGPDAWITIPQGTPTGTVLPAGPAYTLTAALDTTDGITYQGPFTLSAALAANTPEGTNVTVPVTSTVNMCPGGVVLETPVTVKFAQVTAAGGTFVTGTCKTPGSVPANVSLDLGGFQFFFDVSTSAAFTPPITICVSYPDKNPADGKVDGANIDETKLVLLHNEGGAGEFQVAGNNSVDTVLNRVCAEVTTLSPFALGVQGISRGFVPPDRDTRKCEHKLLKEAAKLVKKMITCNRKAAEAALKDKAFDAAGCEAGARTKYNQKIAGLGACPPCAAANAPLIRDAAEDDLVETAVNPHIYCQGSTPLGGDDLGFVPPDVATASCAKKAGNAVAKLTKRLAKCYQKHADAAYKSKASDVDNCLSAALARFRADVVALGGCTECIRNNTSGLENQVDRFVAEILEDVYCAGTVAVP